MTAEFNQSIAITSQLLVSQKCKLFLFPSFFRSVFDNQFSRMKYCLALSFLFAGLALAGLTLVSDERTPLHRRTLDNNPQAISTETLPQDGSSTLASKKTTHVYYHGGLKSQDIHKASRSQPQIIRRSAMKQAEHGSKSTSRSSSPSTQSTSSKHISLLKLSSLSGSSSSQASSSSPVSRSSSSSSLTRTSSGTSWDRPPRDYNEAFRRLGLTPPQSPRSRRRAQSQPQQVALAAEIHNAMSQQASQSFQRSSGSASSSKKAEQSQ